MLRNECNGSRRVRLQRNSPIQNRNSWRPHEIRNRFSLPLSQVYFCKWCPNSDILATALLFPSSLSHHRSADSTARFWFVQNSSSSDSLLSVSQGPVCAHTALSSGVNYISSIDWSVGLFPPFHIEPRGVAPHGLLRRRSARLGPPRQHNRGDLRPAEPRFNRDFLSRQRHSGHRRAALRLRLRALRHRVESGRNRGDFVNSRNSTQFRWTVWNRSGAGKRRSSRTVGLLEGVRLCYSCDRGFGVAGRREFLSVRQQTSDHQRVSARLREAAHPGASRARRRGEQHRLDRE